MVSVQDECSGRISVMWRYSAHTMTGSRRSRATRGGAEEIQKPMVVEEYNQNTLVNAHILFHVLSARKRKITFVLQ